jgi:hypothetical protein
LRIKEQLRLRDLEMQDIQQNYAELQSDNQRLASTI